MCVLVILPPAASIVWASAVRSRFFQACRYIVKDFGTSQSRKLTRQRDSHYAPAEQAKINGDLRKVCSGVCNVEHKFRTGNMVSLFSHRSMVVVSSHQNSGDY